MSIKYCLTVAAGSHVIIDRDVAAAAADNVMVLMMICAVDRIMTVNVKAMFAVSQVYTFNAH